MESFQPPAQRRWRVELVPSLTALPLTSRDRDRDSGRGSRRRQREEAASCLAEKSALQLDRLSGNLLRQVQTQLWAGMETPKPRMENVLQGGLGESCLLQPPQRPQIGLEWVRISTGATWEIRSFCSVSLETLVLRA